MRLVTWNCSRGPFQTKIDLLRPLRADVAVVQECPRPPAESDQCLWFGDNPNKGIAVVTAGLYRLHRMQLLDDVPKFVIPIRVTGPQADFILFAVWSKAGQRHRYVRAVVEAVKMYRLTFEAGPTVLMGDLNANAIWDNEHPEDRNHTALVTLLDGLGMSSA